jgi:8-oxo-dGTP pyrophosphatase MutT (NUDIX family)
MIKREWSKEEIFTLLQKVKPGINAQLVFYPEREFGNYTNIELRKAAVGIHFYNKGKSTYFILIERSKYDGFHSQQIAFPGGKFDEDDGELEYTARRESQEEIGIPINSGKLVTELSAVIVSVSKFIVSPFVFFHEKEPDILINHREVASVLKVKLSDFLENDHSNRDIKIAENKQIKNIPCFEIQKKIVWGATALMLNELKIILKD